MKEGWKVQTLGTICDFQNGFAFKSNSFCETGVGVVRISDIQNGEVSTEKMTYVDPHKINDDLSNFKVRPNDILIAMSGGTTGKLGINKTGKEFFQNQRVGLFREHKDKLNHLYLYYFLQTKTEESLRIAAGAAQPNLSTSQIKGFEIPVPPLSEQDRIVKKLDEAFAKIDALKQNAEKGLQAVKDLWQATLTSLYIRKDGWNTASLGTIASFKNGVNFTPSSNGNKYKFLGVGDFQKRIEITTNELDYVMTSQAIEPDYYLKKDDILIVRSNGSKSLVGRSVVVAEDLNEPVIYSGFCIRCRVAESLYAPFLNVLFKTKKVRKQLTYGDNGCNISNINQKKLSSLEISFPSFDEQKKIVEEIERVSALCENLQANYEQELDEYEALKQSILRKAFSGEL